MTVSKVRLPSAVPADAYDPSQLTTNPYAAEDRAVMEQQTKIKAKEQAKQQAEQKLQDQYGPGGSGGIDSAPAPEEGQAGATGDNTDEFLDAVDADLSMAGVPRDEAWVIRQHKSGKVTSPSVPDSWYPHEIKSSLDAFSAEYQKRVLEDKDGTFKDWLSRRASVFGIDVFDKDGKFDVFKGADAWNTFGQYTATNPNLQKNLTPEEYADQMYEQYGGDGAYDAFVAAKAEANKAENPIQTRRTVTTSTMNNAAAEAAVDDLARGLLGRMGNDKELARYRKQINSFLKANPTVSTEVQDATDPANVKVTNTRKEGASPTDAVNVLEMKMRRGSEGMAFNIGQMFDAALAKMDRNL